MIDSQPLFSSYDSQLNDGDLVNEIPSIPEGVGTYDIYGGIIDTSKPLKADVSSVSKLWLHGTVIKGTVEQLLSQFPSADSLGLHSIKNTDMGNIEKYPLLSSLSISMFDLDDEIYNIDLKDLPSEYLTALAIKGNVKPILPRNCAHIQFLDISIRTKGTLSFQKKLTAMVELNIEATDMNVRLNGIGDELEHLSISCNKLNGDIDSVLKTSPKLSCVELCSKSLIEDLTFPDSPMIEEIQIDADINDLYLGHLPKLKYLTVNAMRSVGIHPLSPATVLPPKVRIHTPIESNNSITFYESFSTDRITTFILTSGQVNIDNALYDSWKAVTNISITAMILRMGDVFRDEEIYNDPHIALPNIESFKIQASWTCPNILLMPKLEYLLLKEPSGDSETFIEIMSDKIKYVTIIEEGRVHDIEIGSNRDPFCINRLSVIISDADKES